MEPAGSARGTKRPLGGTDQPAANRPFYDREADNDDVDVEVTTGEGVTVKCVLPPHETVLQVKQEVERKEGIKPRDARLFVNDGSCEEALEDSETLRRLRQAKGAKVEMSLLVDQADAQAVIPELTAEEGVAFLHLSSPQGVAFLPSHPDWLITTEFYGHCVAIRAISTGVLVCKFGEEGNGGVGQFSSPYGVAVTSNSAFVLAVDHGNHRVHVLRLVVTEDGGSARMEFVCFIGSTPEDGGSARMKFGSGEGQRDGELFYPHDIALLPGEGGQETVLVTELFNHCVSQFALDGTFIRIFAGAAKGEGNGEFCKPNGITVLVATSEVAVVDQFNHRVQIFDSEGNYKRQFGSAVTNFYCPEDGQLDAPSGITSDAHGNMLVLDWSDRLQVFSPEGKHLCTRHDLGLHKHHVEDEEDEDAEDAEEELEIDSDKGIAWSDSAGGVAVANGKGDDVLVFRIR
jgi:DNA-binding beta-propeller fold protein YncE